MTTSRPGRDIHVLLRLGGPGFHNFADEEFIHLYASAGPARLLIGVDSTLQFLSIPSRPPLLEGPDAVGRGGRLGHPGGQAGQESHIGFSELPQ